jgi:hypothetical protein
MQIFKKLMPTRQESESIPVVADLDRMIADPIAVKLFGKIHKIKPMNQETFLRTVNALYEIDRMRTREGVTVDEINQAYSKVFAACCDSIGKKDVDKMTESQKAGFLKQVIAQVQGHAIPEESKKKTLNPLQ